MFNLTGKVALITGGNGGIGLGMALGLARSGADICIWGTNADKNAVACQQIADIGVKATSQICDVGNRKSVTAAFTQTLIDHGRVDGCFANAGIGGRSSAFDEMPFEEWQRVLRVNLDGVFHTFQCAVKHMRERASHGDAGGRIVATGSLAALSGQPRGEHYAATKGALLSMIKALSVEYARHSVTAHTILPGWIETAMTDGAFNNEKFVVNVKKRIPMRRWGVPEDFAGIAVYIMSDASAYHTGESFLIDGGYNIF